MKLFRCPNCRLCIDFEILFKKDLCPMCGMPLGNSVDKIPFSFDNKC